VGDNVKTARTTLEIMAIAPSLISDLTQRAREVSLRAYTPYSKFPVGAAVLTTDGTIYAGANVENASYGLSMCAERNAIFRAIADGAKAIRAVAVYTPTRATTPPCGACRQVMAEFGADVLVICCSDDPSAEQRYQLADLLPEAFGPGHL
jgi:cytidine deaminase